MPAEISFECLLWIQLRRSSGQPPSDPLVGLLDGCPPFLANRQFQCFLPAAFHQFGRNKQEFVPTGHRFGMHALLLDHPHKESPQVVGQEQEAGRRLAHHRLVAAKASEALLVLEFVKNVLRIGPLAIKHHNLPGRSRRGRQARHIGVNLLLVGAPAHVLGRRVGRLHGADKNHAPGLAPAIELDDGLGDLLHAHGWLSLPHRPWDARKGPLHIFAQPQLEKKMRPRFARLLVLGHNFFLCEADAPPG